MYDVHKLKIFLNDIGRGSNTEGFLCAPPCLPASVVQKKQTCIC